MKFRYSFSVLQLFKWVSLAFASAITLNSCGDVSTQGQGTKARAIESSAKHVEAELTGNAAGTQTPGRVIVKFRMTRGVGNTELERAYWLANKLKTAVHHRRALGHSTQSLIAENMSSAHLIKSIELLPEVEWAVEDRRQSIRSLPNDPLFGSGGTSVNAVAAGQWFLRPHSAATRAAIDAQRAWDRQKGDANVVVAVIDTGVIASHPDLIGKIRPGYDFVSDLTTAADGNRRDVDPDDPGDATLAGECDPSEPAYESSWHGTQVAGLIGAATDNNIGVASVGRNVSVLPVRVLGRCGGYDSDIIAGMLWASGLTDNVSVGRLSVKYPNRHPAQVINISLGSQGLCTKAYNEAIESIVQSGITVVAAAGNDAGLTVSSPANCPGVIAVAGIRHIGTKVGYSNIGLQVSLAAPAGNCVNLDGPCLYPLVTTSNAGKTTQGANIYSDGANYSVGTSFAAPLVAATVALMRSANPSLTPTEIKRILERSARPFPASGSTSDVPNCRVPVDNQEQLECYCTTRTCGAGMLNVHGAVSFSADLADASRPYSEGVDRYDPETNQLQIATLKVGTVAYYDVVVTVKQVKFIGNQEKRTVAVSEFDVSTGLLTVGEVSIGKYNYLNVTITVQEVLQVGAR